MTMPMPATQHGIGNAGPSASITLTATNRRLQSNDLLRGQREVLIEHAGETYFLRQTSKGKLILTK